MANASKAKTYMSWLTICFMMVAAVASIRSLPSMAVYGLGSIFLYVIPALLFFIPVSLVASELGTGWNGGIYGWVRQAYGDRPGFFIMWFMWIQVVVWYPIVLGFAASTMAYLINPELAKSGVFTAAVITVLYWLSTFVALNGLTTLSKLTSWFMLLGTALPAVLLVLLGVAWLVLGHKSAAPLTWDALIPAIFDTHSTVRTGSHNLHPDLWREFTGAITGLVLIVSNFLAFAGIEMNAIHARELSNPQKEMPRAILLAFFMILLVFIPPTVAISLVVPADSTSLTAGVIQAYAAFFAGFNMPWATPIMAILLIIGALGGVLAWTAGPSTGLLFVGKAGMLPPVMQKVNSKGVQKNILYLQAVIVTLLSTIYIFIDNVSDAFWMISAMAALMYLIIYVFMFMSAMKLRRTQPNVKRGYVLKGLHGWCYLGLFSTCVALIFGFIPPNNFSSMPFFEYAGVLLLGLVVAGAPPFIFYALRKPSWQMVPKAQADQYSAALQDLQNADDKAARESSSPVMTPPAAPSVS